MRGEAVFLKEITLSYIYVIALVSSKSSQDGKSEKPVKNRR